MKLKLAIETVVQSKEFGLPEFMEHETTGDLTSELRAVAMAMATGDDFDEVEIWRKSPTRYTVAATGVHHTLVVLIQVIG